MKIKNWNKKKITGNAHFFPKRIFKKNPSCLSNKQYCNVQYCKDLLTAALRGYRDEGVNSPLQQKWHYLLGLAISLLFSPQKS